MNEQDILNRLSIMKDYADDNSIITKTRLQIEVQHIKELETIIRVGKQATLA